VCPLYVAIFVEIRFCAFYLFLFPIVWFFPKIFVIFAPFLRLFFVFDCGFSALLLVWLRDFMHSRISGLLWYFLNRCNFSWACFRFLLNIHALIDFLGYSIGFYGSFGFLRCVCNLFLGRGDNAIFGDSWSDQV